MIRSLFSSLCLYVPPISLLGMQSTGVSFLRQMVLGGLKIYEKFSINVDIIFKNVRLLIML